MKRLGFLIFIISLFFCSCNNNEPDLQIELPINAVFLPATIDINKADIDQQEREGIMKLVNNKHIVNDVSELPNDPIGQNEAFHNINYKEHTLLIMYQFRSWTIDTYSNLFYRNTEENSYNWVVRLGTTGNDDDTEVVHLTRFAILVKKLPDGADVITWTSLTQLAVNPE